MFTIQPIILLHLLNVVCVNFKKSEPHWTHVGSDRLLVLHTTNRSCRIIRVNSMSWTAYNQNYQLIIPLWLQENMSHNAQNIATASRAISHFWLLVLVIITSQVTNYCTTIRCLKRGLRMVKNWVQLTSFFCVWKDNRRIHNRQQNHLGWNK